MIDRLDIVGPFRGPSGYDRVTREFVRQFVAMGIDVHLVNLDGWSVDLPPPIRETWFDDLRRAEPADTLLHFTMPSQLMPRLGSWNVNYTMFEADRIPATWASAAGLCDLIVVPTRAARDAWTGSGVAAEKVRIAPLGVDAEFFAKVRESDPLPVQAPDGRAVSDFGTRFLNVGEMRPRKNQIGLLKAWMRATVADDDAVLMLKCPPVPNVVENFMRDVQAMQYGAGQSLSDAAPVALMPVVFSDDEMRSLYATATHYISMSHGEGWDQVMMEAAIAGLHLLAPRHTSYVEYLHEGDVTFIDCTLRPAEFPGLVGVEDKLFFDGLCWWQPDEDAAVEAIRGAIAGRCSLPPPSERLASTYTWEAAACRLAEALDRP